MHINDMFYKYVSHFKVAINWFKTDIVNEFDEQSKIILRKL